MKKQCILCMALLLTSALANTYHNDELKDYGYDYFTNEKDISIKRIKTFDNETLKASWFYTQNGKDNNYEYLRFAVALKGNIETIKFTRNVVGETEIVEKYVSTIYKGISGDNKIYYGNEYDIFDTEITSTNNFYWACYTIRFINNSTYKNKDINLTIDVNDGEYTSSIVTSLEKNKEEVITKRNLSLGDYSELSKKNNFESQYTLTEITSDNIATCAETACTDGEYGYFTYCNWNNKSINILKYNFESKEIIKKSDAIKFNDGTDEDKLYISYVGNNTLMVYRKIDNLIYYFNTEDLSIINDEEKYKTNELLRNDKQIEPKSINYNSYLKQYITIEKDGWITISDENMNIIRNLYDISMVNKTEVSIDDNYIYVLLDDKKGNTTIQVVNYETGLIKTEKINHALNGYYAKSLMFANGNMYLALKNNGGGYDIKIYQVNMKL